MEVVLIGGHTSTQKIGKRINRILLAVGMTAVFASEITNTLGGIDYAIQDNADAEELLHKTHDFMLPRRHHSDNLEWLSIP